MQFSATNSLLYSVMAVLLVTARASETATNGSTDMKLKIISLDSVISNHADIPKNVHLVRKLSGDSSAGLRTEDFQSVAADTSDASGIQSLEDSSRKLLRGGQ